MKLTFLDLLDVVEKINSSLSNKKKTKRGFLSFGLGMSVLSLSFCYIDPTDLARKFKTDLAADMFFVFWSSIVCNIQYLWLWWFFFLFSFLFCSQEIRNLNHWTVFTIG
jgi:hypothetical protein